MGNTVRRKRGAGAGLQTKLTGHGRNFYPLLKNKTVAIGKYISVPGSYWNGCHPDDKDKQYKCIVTEFCEMHDFGGGFKSDGYFVRAPRGLCLVCSCGTQSCGRPFAGVPARLLLILSASVRTAGEGDGRRWPWQPGSGRRFRPRVRRVLPQQVFGILLRREPQRATWCVGSRRRCGC